MAMQGAASRPAGKSVGAAVLGAVLTLAVFVVVFVGFLLAPLALLLLAFLAWSVMKTRQGGGHAPAAGAAPDTPSTHGFGAGAR